MGITVSADDQQLEAKMVFNANRKFKKGQKQVEAYNFIKKAIVRNVYKAQQQLSEKELSAVMGGISRTPIHDALKRLSYEGLVETIPGKGVFVSRISIKDLLEISEIRIPLESLAVKLFIERAPEKARKELQDCMKQHKEFFEEKNYLKAVDCDNSFHYIISAGSMNQHLHAYIYKMIEEGNRAAFLTVEDSQHIERSIWKHQKILDAILNREIEQAQTLIQEHVQDWVQYLKNLQIDKYFLFNSY